MPRSSGERLRTAWSRMTASPIGAIGLVRSSRISYLLPLRSRGRSTTPASITSITLDHSLARA